MLVYHLSDDLSCDVLKTFTPRVPDSAGENEDRITPRICFAPTPELCLKATGLSTSFPNGEKRRFRLYTLDTDTIPSKYFVTSDELVSRGLVPAAASTGEIWVLVPVQLLGVEYTFE